MIIGFEDITPVIILLFSHVLSCFGHLLIDI
jgi:hypothetical protein